MSTQMITNPPVLDTTGQAIVTALNNLTEATSPTNVYIDIPLSIPVSGWDDNTPHVYTWMNENIVGNCGIEVGFADGAEDVATTFIRVTKIVGGIKFSIDEVPSASIPLIVRIINAKADSVIGDIDATMVETSAISGVTNVEEALTDLDGRVDDNADDIASNSAAIANVKGNHFLGNDTKHFVVDPVNYSGDADAIVNSFAPQTGSIYFSADVMGTITTPTVGANRAFMYGFINSTKNYGWAIIDTFGTCFIGKRYGATSFTWQGFATKSDIESITNVTSVTAGSHTQIGSNMVVRRTINTCFVWINIKTTAAVSANEVILNGLPDHNNIYCFGLVGNNNKAYRARASGTTIDVEEPIEANVWLAGFVAYPKVDY